MARVDEYRAVCLTKGGRESAARRITAIAAKHGATVERSNYGGPREVTLSLKLGDFGLLIHLDGASRVGAFLGHWHTNVAPFRKVQYPRDFATTIGGSINEYHFRKATTCEETWRGFLRSIDDGLGRLASLANA